MTTSTSRISENGMFNLDTNNEVFSVEEFIEILNEDGWKHEHNLDSIECVDDDLSDLNNKKAVGAASRRSYNEKTGIIVEYFEGFVANEDGVQGSTEGMEIEDILKIYIEEDDEELSIDFVDNNNNSVDISDFFSDIPAIFKTVDYKKFSDLTADC